MKPFAETILAVLLGLGLTAFLLEVLYMSIIIIQSK